jgi:hypothetical protein
MRKRVENEEHSYYFVICAVRNKQNKHEINNLLTKNNDRNCHVYVHT